MADINAIDPTTGLAQLHVAVGINRFDLVRTLVDKGARFFPDKHGRMPSLIAALCEVDEGLMDFVVDCEERQEKESTVQRLPERRPRHHRHQDDSQDDSQSRRQDDSENKMAAAPRDKDKKPDSWS